MFGPQIFYRVLLISGDADSRGNIDRRKLSKIVETLPCILAYVLFIITDILPSIGASATSTGKAKGKDSANPQFKHTYINQLTITEQCIMHYGSNILN